jgi:protoheme ferro-lyase
MQIEVWLLHSGGNDNPEAWKSHLQRQLKVPLVHQWPQWLAWLYCWFILQFRYRASVLMHMHAPCPSLNMIQEEASELCRLLGPPFHCRSLQYYGPNGIEQQIKSTPPSTTILLLPLQFLRDITLQALIEQARRQLRGHKHRVIELPYKALQEAYIHTFAIELRKAIIKVPKDTQYSILLLLPPQPQSWRKTPEDILAVAQSLRQKLSKELSTSAQIRLSQPYGKPSVQDTLNELKHQSSSAIICAGFGSLLSDGELKTYVKTVLQPYSAELGFQYFDYIDTPQYRTSYFRTARTCIYNEAKQLEF